MMTDARLTEPLRDFVHLACTIGYAHDTGRSHLADEVHADFAILSSDILSKGEGGRQGLVRLLAGDNDHWVRFLAASALLKVEPEAAVRTLEQLKGLDGMVALSASVTLGTHLQRH